MATSSITRAQGGWYELSLKGVFPHPHWIAFLFSGLAESQVSVVSGRALRDDNLQWDTRLMLDFARSQAMPEALDYVALAQRKPSAADMTMPRLSRFETRRTRDNSLEMTLEGPDQIGFLGRLLSRVSLLTLFPIQIEINTVSGAIRDRIVMRGIGGVAPAETSDAALQNLLRSLVA